MELPGADEVRFAGWAARIRPWCEVDHRPLDGAPCSLTIHEGVRSGNHGRSIDRIDGWVEPNEPQRLRASLGRGNRARVQWEEQYGSISRRLWVRPAGSGR